MADNIDMEAYDSFKTESPTPNLRLKNGVLQQMWQIQEHADSTYQYNEWREIEEVVKHKTPKKIG